MIEVINGRAYLWLSATHQLCCCAAYGVDRAICPPQRGPPV